MSVFAAHSDLRCHSGYRHRVNHIAERTDTGLRPVCGSHGVRFTETESGSGVTCGTCKRARTRADFGGGRIPTPNGRKRAFGRVPNSFSAPESDLLEQIFSALLVGKDVAIISRHAALPGLTKKFKAMRRKSQDELRAAQPDPAPDVKGEPLCNRCSEPAARHEEFYGRYGRALICKDGVASTGLPRILADP